MSGQGMQAVNPTLPSSSTVQIHRHSETEQRPTLRRRRLHGLRLACVQYSLCKSIISSQ